jgi:hypothetical protein
MGSSKKTVNSWQLINKRNIGVKTMKGWPWGLRKTCVTVGQRIGIVDKLHPTGEPLHSHFCKSKFLLRRSRIIREIVRAYKTVTTWRDAK